MTNKKPQETVITRRTLVPISLIVVIVAGVLWLANINAKADAAVQSGLECREDVIFVQKNLDQIQRDTLTYMMKIERRLSNIEGFLKKD